MSSESIAFEVDDSARREARTPDFEADFEGEVSDACKVVFVQVMSCLGW